MRVLACMLLEAADWPVFRFLAWFRRSWLGSGGWKPGSMGQARSEEGMGMGMGMACPRGKGLDMACMWRAGAACIAGRRAASLSMAYSVTAGGRRRRAPAWPWPAAAAAAALDAVCECSAAEASGVPGQGVVSGCPPPFRRLPRGSYIQVCSSDQLRGTRRRG